MITDETQLDVMVPTAINLVLLVNDNIISNFRFGQDATLELPSVYKRAYLAVYEPGMMTVAHGKVGQ